jgi:hypothetical protein
MRFVAPLLILLPILTACAVADEPPQVESDAAACATIISCGCTPGVTYTCPSGQIVTCQDGGTWPEEPCTSGEAGIDATVGDATSDTAETSTTEAASDANDAAIDSPAD